MELCSEFAWKQQGPYFEWLFTSFRFPTKQEKEMTFFRITS